MTDNEIKKIILSEECFNFMTFPYDAKAIIYGGSRMLGLENDESDFDLNILISDEELSEVKDRFNESCGVSNYFVDSETEKSIHWYYISENLNAPRYFWYHDLYWEIEANFAYTKDNDNVILLVKDKEKLYKFYDTIYKRFKKNLILLKDNDYEKINYIIKNNFELLAMDKDIYHLCVISCLLNNIAFDKEKLSELKHICKENASIMTFTKIKLNDTISNYAIDLLVKLKEYLDKI